MASKKSKPRLDLRYLPIKQVRPNPWNPFEQSVATFEALRERIRTVGFIDPIHVVETDDKQAPFMILGGKHRWSAALEEGMTEIPAIVLSKDIFSNEDLQKFTTFHLNFRGSINVGKMSPLYTDLVGRFGDKQLQKLFGFTDTPAWEKMTKQIQSSLQDVLPGGAGGKAAKEAKKALDAAKPGSDVGSIIGRIMNKHGSSLQFGFMVFTFEGQEHVYVPMDEELRVVVKDFCEEAEKQQIHLARLLAPALRGALDQLRETDDDEE